MKLTGDHKPPLRHLSIEVVENAQAGQQGPARGHQEQGWVRMHRDEQEQQGWVKMDRDELEGAAGLGQDAPQRWLWEWLLAQDSTSGSGGMPGDALSSGLLPWLCLALSDSAASWSSFQQAPARRGAGHEGTSLRSSLSQPGLNSLLCQQPDVPCAGHWCQWCHWCHCAKHHPRCAVY